LEARCDTADRAAGLDAHSGGTAFALEHADNVGGGAVAEELPERLFVVWDAVAFDEADEILGRIARQG
jgi:hypothetical protein